MEINETTLNQIVDFIFRRVRDRAWLYWPPGPMTGQVFDKDRCKEELKKFLENI